MKFFIVFFLFNVSLVQAESFKIGGELHEFSSQEGLLLKGCEKSCDALTEIKRHKKIKLKELRSGMKFIGSVGSDVCSKAYLAQSVLGVNANSDGRAFCIFKDNSMVEINSLSAYLKKQQIVH